MKKLIFLILIIFTFSSNLYSSQTEDYLKQSNELNTKIENIKKRQSKLENFSANLTNLALENNKKVFIIDFDKDLLFKDTNAGTVLVSIYRPLKKLIIKKYIWGNKSLFMINNIVLDFNILDKKTIENKIKQTINNPAWLDISILDNAKSIEIKTTSNINIEFKLDLEELEQLEIKAEKLAKQNYKQSIMLEQKKQIDSKWGIKNKGPAPVEFIQDIENEMEQADTTNYKESQFPWYLQILRTIKFSGYEFPSDELENKLLDRLESFLKQNNLTKETLYSYLQKKKGIKELLKIKIKKQKQKKENTVEIFLSKLRGFLIRKQEGISEHTDINYYVKDNKFPVLLEYLDKELEKNNNFLSSEFKENQEELILKLTEIKDSAGRLLKKRYSKNVKLSYKDLFLKLKYVIDLHSKKKSGSKQALDYLNKDKLVLQYLLFGNLLFIDVNAESFKILNRYRKFEKNINSDEFICACIDEFFKRFNKNMLRYVGVNPLGYKLFTNPWRILISKISYMPSLMSPVEIEVNTSGKNSILLRNSFMSILKQDYLNNASNNYLNSDEAKQYKNSAKLLGCLLVGNALLRSIGINKEKLSFIMTLFILKHYSQEELYNLVSYIKNSKINKFIAKDNIEFSNVDFLFNQKLLDKHLRTDKKLVNKKINKIVIFIINTYNKYYLSSEYKIIEIVKELDEELKASL
jgi:hypothetical protein